MDDEERQLFYDYEKNQKNRLSSQCKNCYVSSNLETISTCNTQKEELVGGHLVPLEFEYALLRCSHCSGISLAEIVPDFDYLAVVYPPEKRFLNLELPKIVNTSYQEAIRCERSKIPLATVVMVGRTLEALIKEFYPEQKTVFEGLEKLKDDGIISQEIFEWANELRVLRNIGAHAVDDTIELIDAEEAMDFLKAILEIVYLLRPKFIEMKERREKSKQDKLNTI